MGSYLRVEAVKTTEQLGSMQREVLKFIESEGACRPNSYTEALRMKTMMPNVYRAFKTLTRRGLLMKQGAVYKITTLGRTALSLI